MGALQPWHLIIVLAIVLLLFGGQRIPQMMRGMGRGMSEFKKGVEEGKTGGGDDDKPESGVVSKEVDTAKK